MPIYQQFLSMSEDKETEDVLLAFNGIYLKNLEEELPLLAYKLKNETLGTGPIAALYATTEPESK